MVMKLNVQSSKKDLVGLMIFDFLQAWHHNNHWEQGPDLSWIITDPGDFRQDYLNILYIDLLSDPFPREQLDNADRYDLIFLDNHADPLVTSSEHAVEILQQFDHAYIVIDSYLHSNHAYSQRYIPVFQDHYAVKEYWLDSRYPTAYRPQHYKNIVRDKNMIYINGANRSWRHHSVDMLKHAIPDLPVISNYNRLVRTVDSFFESSKDTAFRKWVNDRYQEQYQPRGQGRDHTNYYQEGIPLGSDGKFGEILPGYLLMPEYYEYRCVIFPESTWQNNELALTEKAWKCFFTGNIPMPLGGANIYYLYNQLGLATAWDLLPDSLKQFDQIEDHQQRYHGFVDAVKWLYDNPEVFQSEHAKQILESNYRQCFSTVTHAKSSEILYNILLTADKS
jgi:hypothetical protein